MWLPYQCSRLGLSHTNCLPLHVARHGDPLKMELLQLATLLIKQVGELARPKSLCYWAAVRSRSALLKPDCSSSLLMPLPPSRCCK